LVGSHLPADIFARFCRLKGWEIVFIGGSDENGTPSEITAQKLGITPKRLCDTLYEIHKKIYDWFNISYDNFTIISQELPSPYIMRPHKNSFGKYIKRDSCQKEL
jgi:methionyl-tRNA synthetase